MGVARVREAVEDHHHVDPDAKPGVGVAMRRREDARILRGQGRYVDDIERPGQLHAAFVRSSYARARIVSIAAPEEADGVVAILTAEDLGARVRPSNVGRAPGVTIPDGVGHPVLAPGEVRYVGQPLALVVAATRALAEDAAERVAVEYEPLDPVVDARTAPEMLLRISKSGGDVDGVFAAAEHVVEGSYKLPRTIAAPMETRGGIAEYDAGDDQLTVWVSAQDPHRPRGQLSHILGRPDDTIRVIVPDVGGAFGSKGAVPAEVAAICVAAMQLGRPVKWVEDRLENFQAAYQGRGMEADVALAFDADARLLAIRTSIFADVGAYLYTNSPTPGQTAALLMCGVYDVSTASVELYGARTDKTPTGPLRGAGRPEAAYFLEAAMDAAALRLGIDRVELRRRNLVSSFPHKTPLGFTYDSGDYDRLLDVALDLLDDAPAGDDRYVVGQAVAMYVERAGGQWESADVSVEPSGRVVVRSGSSPHGQGHETTFAQIVAERLGIAMDDVVLRFGDSAVVPRGVGTFASRSAAMGGSAIVKALERIVAQARPLAALLSDADLDDVVWETGRFVVGDRTVTLREVARLAYTPTRLPPGTDVGLHASARFHSPQVFGSGAYGATVRIDRETGILEIVQLVGVDDGGVVINPLLAHGQVIGGIAHAIGGLLVEEAVHDEAGQLRTASFADYSLPTAAEMPRVSIGVVETPSPHNPLGAKGLGEGGTIGTLPAVANAVADALGGRHVDPPYTADKLWLALQEMAQR
ncbi:xanthine dehydrogenase family protein molybdopterin-binding subunit [Conexibacter sp. CPCC 206217]|uniref:xanthine dehydrogenase family protein molybdopterin-binding subunit n=1 Tax=Conexibacter sp. CPCC 206217 TaxID=3064574 RepID=UPI002729057E|nr:xanthine dehydrogenase family protein molybdopterin-binding subunit [Conexibacter sp. CPCC 206217]MDO8212493.1 xanthine dehydrogenase family protein molybdopterin-binding subunit [Conexibacter sp. CPCC 206217]